MAKPSTATPSTDGGVFTTYITLKNGRVIYAADYGLKAFVIYPKKPKR